MNINLTTINHSFSVTNEAGVSVSLNVIYDVSNAPETAIKQWIAADRTIAFQRTLKKLSADEIRAFNGKTVVMDGSRQKTQIDPEAAMIAKLSTMTDEEKQAYITKLIAKAQK